VSRRLSFGLASLLLLPAFLACPADDDDDTTQPADDDASADDDDSEGDLVIELVESRTPGGGDAYPYASAGAPIPWDLWWVPTLQDGDCTYFDIYFPLCDPPCVPPEICVDDGVCEELPDAPYVGTITVSGLSVPLTLTAEAPYYYYVFEFGSEPPAGDLFDGGDAITAAADGGDGVRFTLRSGNHGNQFSSIVCETGDSGELVVGADLLDAYRAGFHPVDVWLLERTGSGQAEADGVRTELRAISQISCVY
jgi:hypothetical protein